MEFFNMLKFSLLNLKDNRKIYFYSIILLQAIRSILFFPLISYLFLTILRITELTSITEHTIIRLLQEPAALFLTVVIGILSVFLIYYEQAYYLVLEEANRNGQLITIREIFQQLNKKIWYFLSLQTGLFTLYFLLILPIAFFGMDAALLEALRVPYFIRDELAKSMNGKILYICLILIISYIGLRLLFSIPFFVTNTTFTIGQAIRKSWQHTKRKKWKIILFIISLTGIYTLVISLSSFLILLPLLGIEQLFPAAAPITAGITLTVMQILLFFSFGFFQAFFAATLLHLISPSEHIKQPAKIYDQKPRKFDRWMLWGGILLFVILSISNSYTVSEILYQPSTKIIAHRGYTAHAIENTVHSLKLAAENKFDIVEIDIQETKDQKFAVFHDTTLTRLTDRRDRVSDLTLEELQSIPIKSGDLTDKIPSLEEMIQAAKTYDIPLLIELKLHGRESAEMVDHFITILEAYGVEDKFLVQSLDEQILSEIKQRNEKIQVGALIAFNIGNLPQTTADFISLEEFSVNQRLVTQAQQADMPIFVWTVNQEHLLRETFRMNVDGIITNQPKQAAAIRDSFDKEITFSQRIKLLMD